MEMSSVNKLSAKVILVALFLNCMPAQGGRATDQLEQLFLSKNIEGTVVVSSIDNGFEKTYNPQRASKKFSPASTFKILNTLIGLKYKVINSKDSVFKWDGIKRGLSAWNQDHTLESAFKVSCVWCYQNIANEVGLLSYSKELKAVSYGNENVREPVDLNWLNGQLKISANEQVGFLKKIVMASLPYVPEQISILKNIMLVESRSNYALYAKSGWTGAKLAVGWYVGYVITESGTFVFSMNMKMTDAAQAPLRKELVIESLKALDLI